MFDAVSSLFTLNAIWLMMLGTAAGVMVGAIPGLTGAMLIALSLPLTFSMSGEHALILLVSMYVGSVSGGLITATLLRIPGTPASMMTTLDGYPMAQAGQPGRALGLGVMASLVGGLISWIFLVFLSGPLADLSTTLGPFEFFALVLLALTLIATISGDSMTGGLLSGCFGILAAMPGASPATGQTRWTFGFVELDDGFKLLPVLVGLFAVNQVMNEVLNRHQQTQKLSVSNQGMWLTLADWRKHIVNMFRSSFIGTLIGILPGIGANIGSIVAYSAARKSSREPERFGHGSEEGVIASEAANNATVGGALIPLIAIGIPGSVIDAILLGAFVIHGLQPGPLLFDQNPEIVYVIMGTMLLANLFMFVFMCVSVTWLAKLTETPRAYLIPIVLTFSVTGSYALANRMFDVWVMLGFGIIGFVMERNKLPLAPFVLGFVLAPIAEEHLCEGLMQTGGSYLPLITRPIALLFTIGAIILVIASVWSHHRSKQNHVLQTAGQNAEKENDHDETA